MAAAEIAVFAAESKIHGYHVYKVSFGIFVDTVARYIFSGNMVKQNW